MLYYHLPLERGRIVGVDGGEGPPVPIPNTEVKLTCADDTWLATARKNRKTPTQTVVSIETAVFLCFIRLRSSKNVPIVSRARAFDASGFYI